jgi:hypothetical protein
VVNAILDALVAGDAVRVFGLGIFNVAARPAREGWNPQTGEAIQIHTEMPGVGGDRDQRLGRGLEQDAVDRGLVVVGNFGDPRRQSEDDVLVGHGQQLGLGIGQPFPRCRSLALRAVAVTA